MSYTDRKEYKTEEFLKEITGHIQRHTIQVKRAKGLISKSLIKIVVHKEVPDKVH